MDIEKLSKIIDNSINDNKHIIDTLEKMKTDLCNIEVNSINLSNIDLNGADLRGLNLQHVNMHGVNLSGADLSGANLSSCNLSYARMCGTILYGANLSGATLCEANLMGAKLCGANMANTNLFDANLRSADMSDTDLTDARLDGTNLSDVNLYRAKNVPFIPCACPETGAFTGFTRINDYVVILEIPENAKRTSSTGRKCRCNKAKVLEIQNLDGTKANVNSITHSVSDIFFKTTTTLTYKIGGIVEDENYSEYRFNDSNIHFFINKQEAVNSD